MKFIAILASLFSFSTFANQDSVAFFYTPEKVIVLINERIESGNRLNDFLDNLGAGDVFDAVSSDESIFFGCTRAIRGTSCKFIFTPGQDISIADRSLVVISSVQELGLNSRADFQMSFASSMNDRFFLKISEGKVEMTGSKKFRKN